MTASCADVHDSRRNTASGAATPSSAPSCSRLRAGTPGKPPAAGSGRERGAAAGSSRDDRLSESQEVAWRARNIAQADFEPALFKRSELDLLKRE